jgi:hypothetical protein
MKQRLAVIITVVLIGVMWCQFQVKEKKIGIYRVFYYSNRCNSEELPSTFLQLTKKPCVTKIMWQEHIGSNIYRWMRWTPETGTEEGILERK